VTRVRVAGAGCGLAFGFMLAWTQMVDPDAIRRMLLLEDAYLFLVMFSAIGVAFGGVRLLRRLRFRALLTGAPVTWEASRPRSRHVYGSVLFGAGWGIACTCPGPAAAQLGAGMAWSLATIAGIAAGVVVHARLAVRARVREAPA
jgi:uncharacterized protein